MGFKRKFEIGDKVRVIKPNDPYYKQIGKIINYYSPYDSKGFYNVKFGNEPRNYYSNSLEKVEDSSSTDTKSTKLSISDLKPGMKVRIRPNLKEYLSKYMYVNDTISSYSGTVHTIKEINSNNYILLNDIPNTWSIENFSEIVEEPKEETTTSEKVELPLKEGQVVTLLDGKQYQVIKNNTKKKTCDLCCLCVRTCGKDRCHITHINGRPSCPLVIPAGHYFKLYEEQNTEDNSSESINPIEKNSSTKEIGIITKVNFTLTDFKLEELKRSKFTVL